MSDYASAMRDYDGDDARMFAPHGDNTPTVDFDEGPETIFSVSAGWSTVEPGVPTVYIDATHAGRIRVLLNDGPAIYDGNPETGESWPLT